MRKCIGTLLLMLSLLGCAGKVSQPESLKLDIKFIANRIWNMEKGPYTFSVLFNNTPEEPVCMQGYVCYGLVNDGSCSDENLRFHADGILPPYAKFSIKFALEDYLYSNGYVNLRDERDFFNQRGDYGDPELRSADGFEGRVGEVILELRVYELVLTEDMKYTQGKILKTARYTLKLDCTTCGTY